MEIWVDLVEEVVVGVNQGRMDGEPLERSSVEAACWRCGMEMWM